MYVMPGHPRSRQPNPMTFTVHCGCSQLTTTVTDWLESYGLQQDDQATCMVILDSPAGFALRTLETHPAPSPRHVIVTRQSCAEYLLDLSEYGPSILVVGEDAPLSQIPSEILAHPKHHGVPNVLRSRLTGSQRRLLRYVAYGWSDRTIARYLSLQPRTVMNRISEILAILGVSNRTAVALYYWGIHPLRCADVEQ